jgi:transmembrane protein 222
MGICTSSGVIRDFAGPYFVSEDLMAFGNPTKYWQLSPKKTSNGQAGWDSAVAEASEIYKKRMVCA